MVRVLIVKTGDALEGEDAIAGDYEPMTRPSWVLVTGAVLLTAAVAVGALWLFG